MLFFSVKKYEDEDFLQLLIHHTYTKHPQKQYLLVCMRTAVTDHITIYPAFHQRYPIAFQYTQLIDNSLS